MVVCVLEVRLQEIVIDILRSQIDLDPVNTKRLKFKHGHNYRVLLQQCMIGF